MALTTGPSAQRRRRLGPYVLLALTACLVLVGAAALEEHGGLGPTLRKAPLELAGPPVLAMLALALACERRWPAQRRSLLARGHLQDACFFLLFAAGVAPMVVLLGVASAHLLLAHPGWTEAPFTARWPRWLLVGLALVAMDGCNWLTHRADHRLAVLWQVHALHHSQEELSVLTTFRTHPLVHTVSFVAATVPVVALMGARPLAPALVTTYLCLGALPHANVRWTYGPVGRILVSPAYHRIHHALDGPYDVNFGIVLTLWDVLARCAVFPQPGAEPCRTGLGGRPLPVEQSAERWSPLRVMLEQLAEPLTGGAGAGPRRRRPPRALAGAGGGSEP